jgi:hypothetical protein
MQRLGNTQPAAIQDAEQQWHNPMSMRDFSMVMACIRLFEKRHKLIVAEDIGNVFGAFGNDIFGQYIGMDSDMGHIQSQLPYDTYPVPQAGIRFIRMLLNPSLDKLLGQDWFRKAICRAELVKFVKHSWTAVIFITQRTLLENHFLEIFLEWTAIYEFGHDWNTSSVFSAHSRSLSTFTLR